MTSTHSGSSHAISDAQVIKACTERDTNGPERDDFSVSGAAAQLTDVRSALPVPPVRSKRLPIAACPHRYSIVRDRKTVGGTPAMDP